MNALWITRAPCVFVALYLGRVTRYVAWVCPRCHQRNRTVVHRSGRPMSREEIEAEHGRLVGGLAWELGRGSGHGTAIWSYALAPGRDPDGLPRVTCGACCRLVCLSMHAGFFGVPHRFRPLHDPEGGDLQGSEVVL